MLTYLSQIETQMIVDNFDLFKKIINPLNDDEFYFVQILIRGKDGHTEPGVNGNNKNRLIKFYTIKSAMLNKQASALRAYRAVKAAFMEYKTAKNAKPLDEIAEINIIRKMISAREDAIQQFKAAGRTELAEAEEDEIKYLKPMLPPEVSEEDVYAYAISIITEKGMQNMGRYVKILKEEFPTADGKMIATIVKSLL